MTREEAIEVVRKNLPHLGIGATEMTDALKTLIPELESEDEMIRKTLIEFLTDIQRISESGRTTWAVREEDAEMCKSSIAYLEKQKEQKPKAKAKSPLSPHELYDAKIEGISQGRQDVLDHPEQFGLQKPAEWSEEDEKNCNRIVRFLEPHKTFFPTKETKEEMQNWLNNRLKSLRPQYHGDVTMTEAYKMGLEAGKASSWKPSEEQMKSLKEVAYNIVGTSTETDVYLVQLYEQLKKLM